MRKLVPIAVFILFVAGCSGGLIRPRVEKGIRNALPNYIGPAKEYTVRADGSTSAMMKGLIESLHIEAKDVQVDPQLILTHLSVDMDQVRYDTGSRKLTSVRNTTFQAAVSEDAVNRYIELTRTSESDLGVNLQPGKVLVEFVPNVAGLDVLVSVAGKLVIVDGDKVNFEADRAAVAHVPMPAYLVNKALQRVNPVLDMSMMRFPVTLQDITVSKGTVVIKGNAQFKL